MPSERHWFPTEFEEEIFGWFGMFFPMLVCHSLIIVRLLRLHPMSKKRGRQSVLWTATIGHMEATSCRHLESLFFRAFKECRHQSRKASSRRQFLKLHAQFSRRLWLKSISRWSVYFVGEIWKFGRSGPDLMTVDVKAWTLRMSHFGRDKTIKDCVMINQTFIVN